MSPLSVLFIEPRGGLTNVFENYMDLPLMGSLILATIISNAGHGVEIWNENLLKTAVDPMEIRADVVCISCLTLSANRAMDLARAIRLDHPGTRIVIGGIHPSLLPDEFTALADHVVVGEGENVIIDVVEGRVAEKIVYGTPVHDLDTLPVVDYGLLKGAPSMKVIPLMTSRGCPFACNFCTVTRIFGRQYRRQSPERIMREVRNAHSFFKARRIFIYDDNLAVDIPRLERLTALLASENLGLSWTAQVRADISKHPELLARMYASGCVRLYIGFESINDSSLKDMHKSQTRADIEKAVEVIHAHGILIHGMFMFGSDHDDAGSFLETAEFTVKHDIDTVQYMILTPFPGTEIYAKLEAENRILHRNWDYYDGMHVLFAPAKMTASELQDGATAAYRRFYSMDRSLCSALHMAFDISYDAMVWNFSRAIHYDPGTLVLKAGARFIINRFEKANRPYYGYLSSIGDSGRPKRCGTDGQQPLCSS